MYVSVGAIPFETDSITSLSLQYEPWLLNSYHVDVVVVVDDATGCVVQYLMVLWYIHRHIFHVPDDVVVASGHRHHCGVVVVVVRYSHFRSFDSSSL